MYSSTKNPGWIILVLHNRYVIQSKIKNYLFLTNYEAWEAWFFCSLSSVFAVFVEYYSYYFIS